MRCSSKFIVSVLLAATLGFTLAPITANEAFSPYVDTKGNISFPVGFRTSMVHLGSWFVPEGDASGFHDVYTEKESVEVYRRTGEFPDGATLVKELRPSQAGSFTTGAGVSYATNEIKQWFVMIKDSNNQFANNPSWGEGWGWALFKPDDRSKNVSTNFKVDCLGCHVPAKDKDWVYTQAYPTLTSD